MALTYGSILSIYFHYAILITASPLFGGRDTLWSSMIAESEGRVVLERARDAAFDLIQAIFSVSAGEKASLC